MLDAGRYFLKKQKRSVGVSDDELIKIAVKSMGLDELKPFVPAEKIIEYKLEQTAGTKIVDMDVKGFANETASESPAPGGGSVSAYVAALGASLTTMVANLSSHKRGWDDQWEFFSNWAEKGQAIKNELLFLVDEDTRSFNRIMDAFGLPKSDEQERKARQLAIQEATKYATEVPFRVMQKAFESFDLIREMVEKGNPASVTDAAVGALCVRTAVYGAFLNVKINAASLNDKAFAENIIARGRKIVEAADKTEKEILSLTEQKMS